MPEASSGSTSAGKANVGSSGGAGRKNTNATVAQRLIRSLVGQGKSVTPARERCVIEQVKSQEDCNMPVRNRQGFAEYTETNDLTDCHP